MLYSYKYSPFGDRGNSQGTIGTDKQFTGQRLDGTGLYFYNARYYDPTIGRFVWRHKINIHEKYVKNIIERRCEAGFDDVTDRLSIIILAVGSCICFIAGTTIVVTKQLFYDTRFYWFVLLLALFWFLYVIGVMAISIVKALRKSYFVIFYVLFMYAVGLILSQVLPFASNYALGLIGIGFSTLMWLWLVLINYRIIKTRIKNGSLVIPKK
jgi:RHS repeat-associated protein